MRTLLGLVLAVGIALGAWDNYKRRQVVNAFLSCVTNGPRSGLEPATRRVRETLVEDMAVADLVVLLREARVNHDGKALYDILSALQGLNPAFKAAAPEVARVMRGEGLPHERPEQFAFERCQAAHVMAMIAKVDPTVVPSLISQLCLPDDTPGLTLNATIANELAPVLRGRDDVLPILTGTLTDSIRDPLDRRTSILIGAVGSIGPKAAGITPRMIEIASNRSYPETIRAAAIEAYCSIAGFNFEGARLDPGNLNSKRWSLLREWEDDEQSLVRDVSRKKISELKREREILHKRENVRLMIAAERVRFAQARPISHPKP